MTHDLYNSWHERGLFSGLIRRVLSRILTWGETGRFAKGFMKVGVKFRLQVVASQSLLFGLGKVMV